MGTKSKTTVIKGVEPSRIEAFKWGCSRYGGLGWKDRFATACSVARDLEAKVGRLRSVVQALIPKLEGEGWWCPECQDWKSLATYHECCPTCGLSLAVFAEDGELLANAREALGIGKAVDTKEATVFGGLMTQKEYTDGLVTENGRLRRRVALYESCGMSPECPDCGVDVDDPGVTECSSQGCPMRKVLEMHAEGITEQDIAETMPPGRPS